mmetsp:Transcript_33094/g.68919  ORF Transcript_33094/g.68919 Transcript_33094/m.68919 type:complete len:85 (-) Transcript_33094:6-260(-)
MVLFNPSPQKRRIIPSYERKLKTSENKLRGLRVTPTATTRKLGHWSDLNLRIPNQNNKGTDTRNHRGRCCMKVRLGALLERHGQ